MKDKCSKCNSPKIRKYGTAIVSGGTKKQRHQCTECGHVFTDEEEIKKEEI